MKSTKNKPRTQRRKRRNALAAGVSVRTGHQVTVLAATGIDAGSLEQLRPRCEQASNVRVSIRGLPQWPDSARWPFFAFIKDIGGVIVEVDGRQFTDAFEGVIEAMNSAQDLQAQKRALSAAVEAATVFHGDVPEIPAARIAKRLGELGWAKISPAQLTKQIKASAQPSTADAESDSSRIDPHAAAVRYLDRCRAQRNLDQDVWPLLYFRECVYEYLGTHWQRLEDRLLHARVTQFLQTEDSGAISTTVVGDCVTNLKGLVLFRDWSLTAPFFIENFDEQTVTDSKFISLGNGMLDLEQVKASEDPQLHPHTAHWFSEVSLPFEYDEFALCPRWEHFLDKVLPHTHDDDRRQEIVEEFLGYGLLPDCQFEKMLIPHGDGANGKSVLLTTAANLFGGRNVSTISLDLLCGEFRAGGLRAKLANISNEIGHLGRVNEGMLKTLISGQPVDVNEKYKEPRKMISHAKLLVATNQLPTFEDPTDGIWRRLILLPFEIKIPPAQQNRQLGEQLKAELPGIFRRILSALRRLLVQNGFSSCIKCNAALARHRSESCSVADFVSLFCSLGHDNNDVYAGRFYELYNFTTRKRGRKPLGAAEFGKRLQRMGINRHRAPISLAGKRPYYYQGIALNSEGRDWEARLREKEEPGWQEVNYVGHV